MEAELTIRDAVAMCQCQASYIHKLMKSGRIASRRAAPTAALWLLNAADVQREAEIIRKNRESRDGHETRQHEGGGRNKHRRRRVSAKAGRRHKHDQGGNRRA